MPLSARALIAERFERITRLHEFIKANSGETKRKIKAMYMSSAKTSVKKTTFYDYLEVLVDSGKVIEERMGDTIFLWDATKYQEERARQHDQEMRNEAEMAKASTLDAFNLEKA